MSVTSLSAYSQYFKKPAFTVHIPPTLYVAGSSVTGELELDANLLRDDDIERIYVELQGTLLTKNRIAADSREFKIVENEFLRRSTTLWVRDGSGPPALGDVMSIPFELQLPTDAPPSFGFETFMNNAHIRYAVEVTGVRTATFAVNRTVKFPIVVLSNDPIGSGTRAELKLGWPSEWGRLKVESGIRRYPWGDYSHAKMELIVPHMDTFPLFTDIPYSIIITALSAPVKRKGNEDPDKNLYPPIPRSASELDFEMRRFVDMETPYKPSNPEEHVVDIISKAHTPIPPVEVEIGDYLWVPEQGRQDRGRWQRSVTFHSHMNLWYTPTFLTEELKIKYTLLLRVEFPGSGNALRIVMPITIGSGVETSIPLDPASPKTIDLPSSYWNPATWTEQVTAR
ncbi:hypothetical protein BD311DRAFT_750339 [Dichomitus squalens]|uniref:Arrestin-like N-terminal domain-containing protein n=1 Tax=Dichomitus squalens TaxID=114155 RepID=A0A4Q9MYT4_9APHY|nr:hypothetical protein BD311DRAFT_750339 [Dichomitus squalens]